MLWYYKDRWGDCAYYNTQGSIIPSNRLIDMYDSESDPSVKTTVSGSLSDPNGIIVIIRHEFATQSLCMGTDCPNIRDVIHWDVPRMLRLLSGMWQSCKRWLACKSSIKCARSQL